MQIGVVFPQTDIGSDPGAVRDYVQAAEDLGYSHLIACDHVLGADTSFHRGWSGGYTSRDVFHEPLVTFGYMAAITKRLELVTATLILGQRQTALVAKPAAEVDLLGGGRLRRGVGIGWNYLKYEALGADFGNRGRPQPGTDRVAAGVAQEEVDFEGCWHRVSHAGINPLPVQRPKPIWMGAGGRLSPIPTERVLRRISRLADGWFPQFTPGDEGRQAIARMKQYAGEAGREPASLGMEARINISDGNPKVWLERARAWEDLGATHVSVNTMRADLGSPNANIDAIRQFKELVRG